MGVAHHTRPSRAVLGLGALGVVFGDIGTSPLYAVQTVFSRDADRPVGVDPDAVYGVISLVFWALVIVVTLQYVVFALVGTVVIALLVMMLPLRRAARFKPGEALRYA